MLQFLPVFSTVFTVFFHCPGKNTFCHGKNPTLVLVLVLNATVLVLGLSVLVLKVIVGTLSLGPITGSSGVVVVFDTGVKHSLRECVCLFVCLSVCTITQKRMIPKCSNMVGNDLVISHKQYDLWVER